MNLTPSSGMQGYLELLGPFDDRGGINGIYGGDARFAIRHARNGWRPDHSLPDTATQTAYLTAVFQTPRPIHSFDPTAQAAAPATLTATEDWKDIEFRPNQYTPPIGTATCTASAPIAGCSKSIGLN